MLAVTDCHTKIIPNLEINANDNHSHLLSLGRRFKIQYFGAIRHCARIGP